MIYHIYTDGSCKGNGKENNIGAYGFLALSNHFPTEKLDFEDKFSIAVPNTTNNRMEISAVLAAIRWAESLAISTSVGDNPELLYIYTDSAYVYNCWKDKWYRKWQTNGWKNSRGAPVENQDLWKFLVPYFQLDFIKLIKVEGHSNNIYNNLIDKIVQETAARGVTADVSSNYSSL